MGSGAKAFGFWITVSTTAKVSRMDHGNHGFWLLYLEKKLS